MPPLGVNSMANGDTSELNPKTSAIKIEESCLLVEIKKEITSENSLRQETYFEATSAIKMDSEFLTGDCSMDEFLPKVGRDEENNFVSIESDIHSTGIRVKDKKQLFYEESTGEDYFEKDLEDLLNDQNNSSWADPMSSQDEVKENYDGNNFAGIRSEFSLKNLLSAPSSERQLSCPHCSMKFCASMRTEYSLHVCTHGESPLLCPVCPKEFRQQQCLMRHLETQHWPILGKQWYHCQNCEARFACSSALAGHLKTLHPDRYFYRAMCKLCLSKLERDRQLKRLLLIVRTSQKCRYVTEESRGISPFGLVSRISRDNMQNLDDSLSCDSNCEDSRFCNKTFFSHGTETERNGECNNSEKYTHYFKNSQNNSTTDQWTSSNFFCPQCPAVFTRQSSLANHLSAHSAQKLFQCPDCACIYDVQKDFYSHWRYHKGELSHYCDFCPQRFSQCCELVTHFKAVHSDKYWSIDKKFTEFQQNNEQIHHSTAQNDKNSTSLASLSPTAGIKTESVDPSTKDLSSECSASEQLHPCKFCSMKFFYRNDLMRHLTKHQLEAYRDPTIAQMYLCPCCPARFVNLCDLTKHLKTSHAHKLCPSSGEQDSKFGKNSMQNLSGIEKVRKPLSAPSSLIPSGFTQLEFAFHTNHTKYSSGNDVIKSIFDVPDEFQKFSLNEEFYLCEFCSEKFFDSSHLMNHFTAQHSDKYLDPALFLRGNACKSKRYLSNETILTNLRLKCPICPAEFIWLSSMINHMKTHDRPFEKIQNVDSVN